MPRYHALEIPVSLTASQSDMVAFSWSPNGIFADFIIPTDPASALRVTFSKPCIVRLLDEMPISTEEDNRLRQGSIPENFAYRIEGSAFGAAQSDAWTQVFAPVSHWRFITGWTCMDVLSGASPSFSVVPRSDGKSI